MSNKRELSQKILGNKSWSELLRDRHRLLHHYQPAGHSQLDLMKQLQQKIQSSGGQLDQMFSFIDSASALD